MEALLAYALALVLFPSLAFAEVSDKSPPRRKRGSRLRLSGVITALLCFAAARFNKLAGIALTAVVLILLIGDLIYYILFHDAGRYAYYENGIIYFMPYLFAALLVLIGGVSGFKLKKHAENRR